MNTRSRPLNFARGAVLMLAVVASTGAQATDKELLDILLSNGAITQEQYEQLLKRPSVSADDVVSATSEEAAEPAVPAGEASQTAAVSTETQEAIAAEVSRQIESESPVVASYGSKGFQLATRDGKFETNLQWRAQFRYSNPYGSDPRQIDDFEDPGSSNFEARRLRMKIGGHGFQPWMKYYFEVDLQPSRDVEADPQSSGARVIDWRVDLAKWDWLGLRLGQWKVDLTRERVDSSGRQQFVERSIVNRIFTLDRQVGIQVRGRLFEGTPADLRYYAGVFNGEGRSVTNQDDDHLYLGRVQWNFLGRDVPFRQTDVEFTENAAGSLALAAYTNTGVCTRWSSSGCGNLDGFERPFNAAPGQYEMDGWAQEFAFKYRGLSIQQEYHRKNIDDRVLGIKSELTGFYAQAGYFFHGIMPAWPEPLELAFRYAYVEEPNEVERLVYNERAEYTFGANWFFNGHRNKLTADFSHLTLDDGLELVSESENRVRLQWDVSF